MLNNLLTWGRAKASLSPLGPGARKNTEEAFSGEGRGCSAEGKKESLARETAAQLLAWHSGVQKGSLQSPWASQGAGE